MRRVYLDNVQAQMMHHEDTKSTKKSHK